MNARGRLRQQKRGRQEVECSREERKEEKTDRLGKEEKVSGVGGELRKTKK